MGSFVHGEELELVTELQGKSEFLLALTCSKASLIFNLFLPISDLILVTLKSTGAISQGIGTEVVCVIEPRRTASPQSDPQSSADPKRRSTSLISQQSIFVLEHMFQKNMVSRRRPAAGPPAAAQDVPTVTLPLLFSPAAGYF